MVPNFYSVDNIVQPNSTKLLPKVLCYYIIIYFIMAHAMPPRLLDEKGSKIWKALILMEIISLMATVLIQGNFACKKNRLKLQRQHDFVLTGQAWLHELFQEVGSYSGKKGNRLYLIYDFQRTGSPFSGFFCYSFRSSRCEHMILFSI
jgi:hypothetical protein